MKLNYKLYLSQTFSLAKGNALEGHFVIKITLNKLQNILSNIITKESNTLMNGNHANGPYVDVALGDTVWRSFLLCLDL